MILPLSTLLLVIFLPPSVLGVNSVKVLLFVPLTDTADNSTSDLGYAIIPAVKLAVEQINNTTNMLHGFTLDIVIKDSGCDHLKTAVSIVSGLRAFLANQSRPVAVIGPNCAEATIITVNTFHRSFNLPVLYSSRAPYLSEYFQGKPNAFGIVSSTADLIDALIRIGVKENWDWKNIAILYDDSKKKLYAAFAKRLCYDNGISQQVGYASSVTSSRNLVEILHEISEKHIRVIIVFLSKGTSLKLACLAKELGGNFVFPVRQFIFIDKDSLGIKERSFTFTQQTGRYTHSVHCNEEAVAIGINGAVFLHQELNLVDPDILTVSNYTAGQLKDQYRQKLLDSGKVLNMNVQESTTAYRYYDAMWAVALGLSTEFTTSSESVNKAIIVNVSFQGISGWIDFRSGHHVSSAVSILQADGSSIVQKGLWNGSTLTYAPEIFIKTHTNGIESTIIINSPLRVLGLLLALLLLVTTAVLQLMTIVYRNSPSVKADSPQLNHFIYFGCYLLIASLVINSIRYALPTASGDILCNVHIMSNNLATTFIFGTLLVKSCRIYKVFSRAFKTSRAKKYGLRDPTLATVVVCFVLVQALVCLPVLITSPFKEVTSVDYDYKQWPPVRKVSTMCVIQSITGYVAIPLTFHLCLISAAIVYAIKNDKVNRKHFRATKRVILLVYFCTVIWGPMFLTLYGIRHSTINMTYSIYSCVLISTVTLFQFVLIIPSFVPVLSRWVKNIKIHN